MTRSLMTADEVAEMLGVSRDWVYSEARAGRIPHIALGRCRRFRRETVEQWLTGLELASIGPTTKSPPRRLAPSEGTAPRK